LLVGFYLQEAAATKGITYAEALDEALAFGWIDGIRGAWTTRGTRSVYGAESRNAFGAR
jgi:hypothetical protein